MADAFAGAALAKVCSEKIRRQSSKLKAHKVSEEMKEMGRKKDEDARALLLELEQRADDEAKAHALEVLTGHGGFFVDDPRFNGIIGLAIFFNGLMMGIEVDHELGTVGTVMNHIFTAVWTIEMVARLWFLGFKIYFLDAWYRLDFVLTCFSIFDVWILPICGVTGGIGVKLISVVRVLRIVRVIRLIKVLRAFEELWLLVNGISKAIRLLSWVVLLLSCTVYVCALFTTQSIGQECGEGEVYADWENCYLLFGTVPRSMYTLFQVITLESWSMVVVRPVIEKKPWMVVTFMSFMFMTTFGFMNVVTGVIVEQTLKESQESENKLQKQKEELERSELDVLQQLFEGADKDRSGFISRNEFMAMCAEEHVQHSFVRLGMPVDRPRLAKRLFEVLDADNTDHLKIEHIIKRTFQLLSEGRSLLKDETLLLMDVRHNNRRLHRVEVFQTKMDERLERLEVCLGTQKQSSQSESNPAVERNPAVEKSPEASVGNALLSKVCSKRGAATGLVPPPAAMPSQPSATPVPYSASDVTINSRLETDAALLGQLVMQVQGLEAKLDKQTAESEAREARIMSALTSLQACIKPSPSTGSFGCPVGKPKSGDG
eukprot:gnl/MRDRNA2_/MRDRNA2_70362_c0_seq1.p1 gnl/MRDRNA2_/MRDRNA2_70362_c0~~gnl/MRDRNA2_/MRDRNA2_70362_c0_seq1.p1  ORF type:complete len:602 (-),score=101.23 gnl/MRDRNA2_/MRDRNA2_70362_c0_seq1:40-1845(-)